MMRFFSETLTNVTWKMAFPATLAVALVACSVNPVTGKRHFQFYGTDWEQQVGGQMYVPLKQSQGGDFILDPELTRYVNEVGNKLAAQAQRQDELKFEFSVLNNSTPNAWALPGGKIVINRGLLTELDSEAELAAVMAHEIVHADAAHGARQQSTGMLAQVGALASMVVLGSKAETEAGRQISMLVPTVGMQLVMQRYSRDAERESDEYGIRYMSAAGYDPQGAVELQETFVELSKDRRDDWLTGLFASHPPSMERVENNRETAAGLPAGGDMGRARYQEKIAYLKRVEPAYELYDEASKALSEGDSREAQEKLDRALRIEPREALFLALQGDIYASDDKNRKSLRFYDKAIDANEGLFYGYLRKGQVEYEMGRSNKARTNLEKSLELLPTAEAHYLLGKISQQAGDSEAAMSHFAKAAESQSEAGQRAQGEIVRLDIKQNPARYVQAQAALDNNGYVWIQIQNRTRVSIADIAITYAWLDDRGNRREDRRVIPGPLESGQQEQFRLGIRLPDTIDLNSRFRVEVTDAAVR